MTQSPLNMSSETQPAFPPIVEGKLIFNGQNPFIRLSNAPGEALTSDAAYGLLLIPLRAADMHFSLKVS